MIDCPSPSPIPPEMPYSVRACRGHYHVQLEMGNGDTEDLMVRGDPFKTREEAQAIADKRNAGISWEEIEGPPATSLPAKEETPTHAKDCAVHDPAYAGGSCTCGKVDRRIYNPFDPPSKWCSIESTSPSPAPSSEMRDFKDMLDELVNQAELSPALKNRSKLDADRRALEDYVEGFRRDAENWRYARAHDADHRGTNEY